MDITAFDITILVASTIGIVLMSFTFPALGLTGEETTEDEIPEFEVGTDRFDFAGDFPTRPSSPDGGTLTQNYEGSGDFSAWLTGGGENGQLINIGNFGNETNIEPRFTLAHYDDGNTTFGVTESKTLNQSESVVIENAEWRVRVEITVLEEGPQWRMEGVYEILDEGEGSGNNNQPWYSGVPILGDAASGLQWVAQTMVYIGNILLWAVSMSFEIITNMVFMMFDVVTFMFGLAEFLVTTYTDVISAEGLAPWASVILVIPGIMLMAVWAKLAVVAVEVIWIG